MPSDARSALAARGAPALLDLLVWLGLASYARRIDADEPPLQLLCHEGRMAADSAGIGHLDWPAQRVLIAEAWNGTEGPLRRLAALLALAPADLFLIGLAAGCERHRTVSLAVAALQAPFAASRPSVHLALDLLQVLFDQGAGDALALATGPLVDVGLLSLNGDEAVPHRVIAIRLPLWRALTGGPPSWPGGRAIASTNPSASSMPAAALERAAQAIAGGEAGGLVIRGPPGSGRAAVAAALAANLRLAADRGAACGVPRRQRLRDRLPRRWLDADTAPRHRSRRCDIARRRERSGLRAGRDARRRRRRSADRVDHRSAIRDRTHPPLVGCPGAIVRMSSITATLTSAVLYPGTISAVARAASIRAESETRPVTQADIAEARRALAPDGLGPARAPGQPRRSMRDALVTDARPGQ